MANAAYRAFPPYEGDEPYLYFCFLEADFERVKPLIRLLYGRGGCGFYSVGKVLNPKQNAYETSRIKNAALMVLYCTDAAAADSRIKSSIGCFQQTQRPIISLEAAKDAGGGVKYVFSVPVRSIPAYEAASPEALMAELIRTEGFSQALIGEPAGKRNTISARVALPVILLSLLAAASVLFYARKANLLLRQTPTEDAVAITDAVLSTAARYPEIPALVDRLLTAEAVTNPALTAGQKKATRRFAVLLSALAALAVSAIAAVLFLRYRENTAGIASEAVPAFRDLNLCNTDAALWAALLEGKRVSANMEAAIESLAGRNKFHLEIEGE